MYYHRLTKYSYLRSNRFNIYVDILCKSQNLVVHFTQREFGERDDSNTLKRLCTLQETCLFRQGDRIMLETKMVKICLQTMLTVDLHNNNNIG
jgi:hypothetical protein